ncbi:hypothetical protein [Azospirillum sp. BE72]|uniref:hypothetical protein n=1 Tax=Azospirillum sp. BE72 TaxID=2817776 RepID=UPI00285B7025|nr:hypothetical protein [Azospirillum sp. BE72]MDR6775276.1 putative MFS family arabinose efflux permease [Azospirillum sp. BE72]
MAWASISAFCTRLITGPQHAPIILSVNASFHYSGFSLGVALGWLVLSVGSVRELGWVGAFCVVLACLPEFAPAKAPRMVEAPAE